MAQRGGKRAGAGRKPGQVSAAKRAISEMAKDHAESALETLASIMQNDQEPASARISAANSLLDRGYGKPFASEPERDEDTPATSWVLEVRPAKGPVRVTKSE